jgi:single-strand DNA-binding protein
MERSLEMAGDINRVVITGRLTKDPELSAISGGDTSVCSLRIASNGRRRNPGTGQWEDAPNYFDVTVWGQQGENCQKYLHKGRAIAIDGRLRFREWTSPEGQKRNAVDIIAESVQFLGGRDDGGGGNGNGFSSSVRATESDVPIDTGDFESTPVAAGVADDDIPF